MPIFSIRAAKAQLSHLLERAHAGEEITIAKHGKLNARLMPLAPEVKRPLGFVAATIPDSFSEPLPVDELVAST